MEVKTPYEAMMSPFQHNAGEIWQDPKLDSLKREVYKCTVFMVGVPLAVYFYVKSYWTEYFQPNENEVAGLAAVASVQLVMVAIVIVYYLEDFRKVYRGEGHIPYDQEKSGQASSNPKQHTLKHKKKHKKHH